MLACTGIIGVRLVLPMAQVFNSGTIGPLAAVQLARSPGVVFDLPADIDGRWRIAAARNDAGDAKRSVQLTARDGLVRASGLVGIGALVALYARGDQTALQGTAAGGFGLRLPKATVAALCDPMHLWRVLAGVGDHRPLAVDQVDAAALAGERDGLAWLTHQNSSAGLALVAPNAGVDCDFARLGLILAGRLRGGTDRWTMVPATAARPGSGPLLRIRTTTHRVYWPRNTLAQVLRTVGAVAGRPREAYALVALVISNLAIATGGVPAFVLTNLWTPAMRRARYGLRATLLALKGGGRVAGAMVDACYAKQELFDQLLLLLSAMPTAQRELLRPAFGPRRADQLFARSDAQIVRGGDPAERLVQAGEAIMTALAARTRYRGAALPATLASLVETEYRAKRDLALREAWKKQRNELGLLELLESARLSHLRNLARRVPRQVLVDAGVGADAAIKRSMSRLFSRRGRRLFMEDVTALEAALKRGEYVDYERLNQAVAAVAQIAQRAGGVRPKRRAPESGPNA